MPKKIIFIILTVVVLVIMGIFNLNKKQGGPEPISQFDPNETLLVSALRALDFTDNEIYLYEFLFYYGPQNQSVAIQSPNFPTHLSQKDLDNFVSKYEGLGYLVKEKGGLKTSGISFLAEKIKQQAIKNPNLKNLYEKIVEWEHLSTQ